MPCQETEEEMNAPDAEPPCTPTKPTANDGAGLDDTDDEDGDDEDLPAAKLKRKWNGKAEWTSIK